MSKTEFQHVPIDQIKAEDGFNPRHTVEVDPQFLGSVQAHGILQPIRLRKNGSGYLIVAGERRYSAAILAELTTIPAVIELEEQSAGDNLAQALIENIHREDLNPVEQAQAIARLRELGFTSRKQLAAKTGLSEKQIKSREQIAALPAQTQDLIVQGKLKLNAIEYLAEISQQSPALAAYLASEVKPKEGRTFGEAAHFVIERAEEDVEGIYVFDERQGRAYALADLDLGEEVNKIVEQWNAAHDPRALALTLSDEALQAAEASGCLIRTQPAWEHDSPLCVVTSTEWLANRYADHIKKNEASLTQQIVDAEKAVAAGEQPTGAEPKPEGIEVTDNRGWEVREAERKEQEKVQRKADREEWMIAKDKAVTTNQELAKQLFERVKVDSPDKVVMKAIIALAIDHDGGQWALRGMRFLHPAYEREETTDGGKKKTVLLEKEHDARKLVAGFLDSPTVEGMQTKFLQLLVAAYAADENQVARTRRHGHVPVAKHTPGGPAALEAAWNKGRRLLTPKLQELVTEALAASRDSAMMTGPFDEPKEMGVGGYEN